MLSPRSVRMFDTYCHPAWLSPESRQLDEAQRRREAKRGQKMVPAWKEKVLLKEWWIDRCFEAGRLLVRRWLLHVRRWIVVVVCIEGRADSRANRTIGLGVEQEGE